jgi:N-carbamoylputrescine amidase
VKERFQLSVVQFASEWLDLDTNVERMRAFVEAEAEAGSELIAFPETANIGYITPITVGEPVDCGGLSNAEFASRYVKAADTIPGPTTDALCELAAKHGVHVVVGMAQAHSVVPATLYNSAVLIGPAGIVGVHHKMHIALNEKQYYYPGNTAEVFDTELGKIGMIICYDARFPELSRILALKGAEIIVCPWCVPAIFTVPDVLNSLRHRTYTRAQENGVYFVSVNRSGMQGQTQLMGHSVVAAPSGEIIAASETAEEDVVRVELTEERLLAYRGTLSIFRDRRPELYGKLVEPFGAELPGDLAAVDVDRLAGHVAGGVGE